jgi:hypothetical protein
MYNTEMHKLVALLVKADIPFEIYPFTLGEETWQIAVPNKAECVIDAVSHKFSYGGDKGLIEVMGSALDEMGDVIGWLSGEEAFEHFKATYKGK